MDHIGIDAHKRESQIYLLAEGGEIIEVIVADPNFAPMYATRTRKGEDRPARVHFRHWDGSLCRSARRPPQR